MIRPLFYFYLLNKHKIINYIKYYNNKEKYYNNKEKYKPPKLNINFKNKFDYKIIIN